MSSFFGLLCLGTGLRSAAIVVRQIRPELELTLASVQKFRSLIDHRAFSTYTPRRPNPLLERRISSPWHAARRQGLARTLFTGHVIKHYVDLPPDYQDHVGLPFRRKDLDQGEVMTLFGPGTNVAAANRLLRVLHGRRVAGTLDEPELQRARPLLAFSRPQQRIALEYLRKSVPVDETINAGLRAEDELQKLEEQEQDGVPARASLQEKLAASNRFTLYKDQDGAPAHNTGNVYGEGVIDQIRAANRAKREERLRREEEEEERLRVEGEARQPAGPLQVAENSVPRELGPQMKKWTEAATSDLQEAPALSLFARLAPVTAFVVVAVGAMVLFAHSYDSPDWLDRQLPNVSPALVTIAGIVGVNVLVYAAWKVPRLWRLLNRYFLFVAATPKPLSMLGAVFSHQKLIHLASNMLFAWFFGIRLHDEVGRGDFLAVYVSSGLIGFLGTYVSILVRGRLDLTTLGASGALYGVTAAYFWLHRFEGFKIFGLPPDPYDGIQGLGFIGLLAAMNIAAAFSQSHVLDVASHLMGLAVGVVAGAILERKGTRGKKSEPEPKTDLGLADRAVEKN